MKSLSSHCFLPLCIATVIALLGCKPKEAETSLPQAATTSAKEVSIDSIIAIPNQPPTLEPVSAIAPSAPLDMAKAERPLNTNGNPMSDLEYLNQLVQQINESRTTPKEINQKAFKTEAEQLAYEEAQQATLTQGPIKDLNELVSTGVIKALPAAPVGQRYVLDATSGKVVLQ